MKVVVVYNRDSQNVINLFGQPNREKVGLALVQRIVDALKAGGHQAIAVEADKDLIARLEEFMPRVVKGERPGMVFNLSYGIQGQARYTHVPSILEMMGIPYVASGPLAHSIALDKVITKMVLVQHGLPTPAFAVLERPDFEPPQVEYPVIVKPKHEAVSFGIRVCNDEGELREAAGRIFDLFGQAVLVEQFVEGREINVGLLGNAPPEALPPVELGFGDGPTVYSYEDKTGRSGRKIELLCPAPIDEETTRRAQDLARRAFNALGIADCARVDFRLAPDGQLYILELNSLPSMGPRGSYVRAAAEAGLDFTALVNRLIDVAAARYFGTPKPVIKPRAEDPASAIAAYITERRDRIERRVRDWVRRTSRTSDAFGIHSALEESSRTFGELGLAAVPTLSDERSIRTLETEAGLEGGTLLVCRIDVPLAEDIAAQSFRREPEWLAGEGIAVSRAPLVMAEYALRALRNLRGLRRRRIGVALLADEGADLLHSRTLLRAAMDAAGRVLVLRPGGSENTVVTQRRGQRRYRLTLEGEPVRPGRSSQRQVVPWFAERVSRISGIAGKKQRLSISVGRLRTDAFPMLLPHRLNAEIIVTYVEPAAADEAERGIRETLGRRGPRWRLELLSDRPPLTRRASSDELARRMCQVARQWDVDLKVEDSVWPSPAGLAPLDTAVVCGVGPVGRDLYTPDERVQRLSLIQRTLILSAFLLDADKKDD